MEDSKEPFELARGSAIPEQERKVTRVTCFIVDPRNGHRTEITIDDFILGVREIDERRWNQMASEFEEEI